MATIVFNVSRLHPLHQRRGVGIYTQNLFAALKAAGSPHTYILAKSSTELKKADIIHFPHVDFFSLILPQRKTTKWVVTIHDTVPLIFPEKFPPGLRGKLKFKLQHRALKQTNAIITDSHSSKADIQKYLRIEAEKIYVIPLGVSPEFKRVTGRNVLEKVLKKYTLKQPFILYVGDVNYNKNLPGLVTAFAKLPQKHVGLTLVSQAWKNKTLPEVKALNGLMQTLDIQDRIRLISDLGSNPVRELVHLYNLAAVYVQPSLYEGFGLPVLEAMACGTPVVVTNVASLPEVSSPAAIMVEPTVSGLISGINEALNLSPAQKRKRIKLGRKHAVKFSWENTARKTIDVYNHVLESQ